LARATGDAGKWRADCSRASRSVVCQLLVESLVWVARGVWDWACVSFVSVPGADFAADIPRLNTIALDGAF